MTLVSVVFYKSAKWMSRRPTLLQLCFFAGACVTHRESFVETSWLVIG